LLRIPERPDATRVDSVSETDPKVCLLALWFLVYSPYEYYDIQGVFVGSVLVLEEFDENFGGDFD